MGRTAPKIRCAWAQADPLLAAYHDREYGRPLRSDEALLERLTLEIFQAGLSWRTILYKKPALREAFHDFNIRKVADLTGRDVSRLLKNPAIIRNRLKIEATIHNARQILKLRQDGVPFLKWIEDLPTDAKRTEKIFKATFRFVGPEIINEFLTSIGRRKIKHQPQCWLAKNNR